MNKSNIWFIILIPLLLLFIIKTFGMNWSNLFKNFMIKFELFKATPYWDFKQWSWGYGTKVPNSSNNSTVKPTGYITKDKAMNDAISHANTDYLYLKGLLKKPLSSNQWAALLSFSYNLGSGSAANLIPNINNSNNNALKSQWVQYINAGGVPNANLLKRRQQELNLFFS